MEASGERYCSGGVAVAIKNARFHNFSLFGKAFSEVGFLAAK